MRQSYEVRNKIAGINWKEGCLKWLSIINAEACDGYKLTTTYSNIFRVAVTGIQKSRGKDHRNALREYLKHIQEYGLKLAVSPNQLNKVVKKETGKSTGELIDEMLIMEIKAMLKYTDLSISEIAYQLDFTDTSHFSKFFKRYAGIAPAAYRQKNR